MIYLDSSCLLKLLLEEPESEAVRQAVAGEADVVISPLTKLETAVQLRAGRLGAVFGERRYRAYLGKLEEFRVVDPFRFPPLPSTVFQTALRQQRSARQPHCRTLLPAIARLWGSASSNLGAECSPHGPGPGV